MVAEGVEPGNCRCPPPLLIRAVTSEGRLDHGVEKKVASAPWSIYSISLGPFTARP